MPQIAWLPRRAAGRTDVTKAVQVNQGGRTKPSIAVNTGWLIASRIAVSALGWAGIVFIIRMLSVDDWGRYTFIFSFLSLTIILTNVVNARAAIRGLIHHEDRSTFAGSYVLLRMLLGVVGYIAAIVFVVVGGYPSSVVRTVVVAATIVLIATPSVGYDVFYQTDGRLARVAVANVSGQVVQFALTVVLAIRGVSLLVICIPGVVCELVTLGVKLKGVRRLIRIRYRIVLAHWWELLKTGIPYAIGAGLAQVYYSIDSVMLSKMQTFSEVGVYGISYKFAAIINFVPYALSASLLAPLVSTWPHRAPAFWATWRKAIVMLFLVAVPVAFEFVLFAGPAIGVLFGHEYTRAAGATRLVIGSECIGFFSQLAVTVAVAMNRNRLYPIAALAGVLVNVGLNLYAIPRYSYHGAALATFVTEIIVCTVLWIPMLRIRGRAAVPVATMAKTLGAGAVAVGVALVTRAAFGWLPAAVLSGLVYLAIVHVARIPGPTGLPAVLRDDYVLDDLRAAPDPA